MIKLSFFIFGAIVGSFLNVCIHRLPREESIKYPGSHCPKCGRHIRWYDNIPLLSYIVLRGKCRYCCSGISPRYFGVELITALLFLSLFLRFGLCINTFIYIAFISSLIIMSFIDIEHRIIPDVLDCWGIAAGLVISAIHPAIHVRPQPWDSLFKSTITIAIADSLSGIVLGGGFLIILAIAGKAVFKKEAMGGGDVKVLAMIGAFLGWQMVIVTIFISALIGSVVGIAMKLKLRRSYIPYGPYLAIGAIIAIFYGAELISWYTAGLG